MPFGLRTCSITQAYWCLIYFVYEASRFLFLREITSTSFCRTYCISMTNNLTVSPMGHTTDLHNAKPSNIDSNLCNSRRNKRASNPARARKRTQHTNTRPHRLIDVLKAILPTKLLAAHQHPKPNHKYCARAPSNLTF
jgi:hypothetical protein